MTDPVVNDNVVYQYDSGTGNIHEITRSSAELVTDPHFEGAVIDPFWTTQSANITLDTAANKVDVNIATGVEVVLRANNVFTVGVDSAALVIVSGITSGNLSILIGNASVGTISIDGEYIFTGSIPSDGRFQINSGSGGFVGSIDEVSGNAGTITSTPLESQVLQLVNCKGTFTSSIYQGTKTTDTTLRTEGLATGVTRVLVDSNAGTGVVSFYNNGVLLGEVADGDAISFTVTAGDISWSSVNVGTIELGQGTA